MTATEYVLESLGGIERHLKLLTAAVRPEEIVGATINYLASWPEDRIQNLQKIDGGWGTFDQYQRPEPISAVADLVRISQSLRRHCLALKDAGIEPTPELLELDLYFALAEQVAEVFLSTKRRASSVGSRNSGYQHWSDRATDLSAAQA